MKKDTLIELLQSIKGNPEILFWNSMVEDYQDISKHIIEDKQVKETPNENYRKLCDLQRKEKNQEPLTNEEWLTIKNNLKKKCDFVQKFETSIWDSEYDGNTKFSFYDYKYRTVYYLQMIPRNKSTFDRLGKIEY